MANREDDASSGPYFWIGDLRVQPDRLLVIRGEEEIKLERRMMEVLVFLAEHAGETISGERLLIEIWGNTVPGDEMILKTISVLRKLIGDDARNPRYIKTVHGAGYSIANTR
jgi:DNA-binding winged helix-turn-helix (wHTH) protein